MRAAHFTTSDTVIPPILRCGWGSSAGSHCVRRLRIVDGAGIALPQHDVGLQDLLMEILGQMGPVMHIDHDGQHAVGQRLSERGYRPDGPGQVLRVAQHDVQVAGFMGAAGDPASVGPDIRLGHVGAKQAFQHVPPGGTQVQVVVFKAWHPYFLLTNVPSGWLKNLIMISPQTESSYEVRTGQYPTIKYLRSFLYGGLPEEPCFASLLEA